MAIDTKINIKCFAIMPFDEEFDSIRNLLIEEIDKMNSRDNSISITLERADQSTMSSLIPQNIHEHIKNCDIAIIDLTNQNNNVIFEFGYAVAAGKHIIPMTQDRSSDLATDYRPYIYINYSVDDLDTFRSSFRLRLKETVQNIKQEIEARELKKEITIQSEKFDVTCYKNRKVARLQEKFSLAKDHIRIIQTNLATVTKDYADSIKGALDNNPDLEVRLLTLDPESYYAAVRATQLGNDISEFRNEMYESLHKLYTLFKDASNFEIRVYDDFPTQICFMVDEVIYNCVVSKYQPSRRNCLFELDAKYPSLHISFNLHFTSVWRDPITTRRYDSSKRRYMGFESDDKLED